MSKTYKKLSVVKTTPNFREAVRVVDVPLVEPSDDQVLVRSVYVGVNAGDINVTAARFGMSDGKVPFDVGLEALGVVESVGKNITNFKVGQPVLVSTSIFQSSRSYSEYIYAQDYEVAPVPSLRPEFIALPFCGLTAVIGLDEAGRVKAGDKVLITASAGGTGHIGVQWAKKRGAHVIGLTSSEEKAKLLKELGTDRVINYRTEDLDQVLSKEYPTGVDVVWETIGGKVFETLFKHLAPKGRLVVIGGISGYQTEGFPDPHIPNLYNQLLLNNQSINGFHFGAYLHLIDKYRKELIEDIMSGKLRVVLDLGQNTSEGQFVGIDAVVRGVEHLHSGKNIGKVAIKIGKE